VAEELGRRLPVGGLRRDDVEHPVGPVVVASEAQ
jgi:hypothetical protein